MSPDTPARSPLDGFALGALLQRGDMDAFTYRERKRLRRIGFIALVLFLWLSFIIFRLFGAHPLKFGLPSFQLSPGQNDLLIPGVLIAVLALVIGLPMVTAGRSPHQVFQPNETGVALKDVVGASGTVNEAIDTLNLFLAHKTFTEQMGGQARRGVLFEGPPGTGKTYLAKAMAAEAGVPFLFVPASAFQSMYFGQTNRKIRSYFKALRTTARREGGAIGFIDEFDAIGLSRQALKSSGGEGFAGVVNELLVQMQSFEVRSRGANIRGAISARINLLLPIHRRIPPPKSTATNVLLVAATNRAAELDPALLRPGRFDRIVHFGLPALRDRAEIADFYLGRKAHTDDITGRAVAEITAGYSPAELERLLDESLICALRARRNAFNWSDLLQAKMVNELGQPGESANDRDERWRIAVHEAGHALVAELVGRHVTVASILRRADALGLVAHDLGREVNLHTPTDARAMIHVALAGMVSEELEFGEASSGIASDLSAATRIVASLVGAIGAGGSRLSLDAAEMNGAANLVSKVLSDDQSRASAEQMLVDAERRTRSIVEGRLDTLKLIAQALFDQDELTGDEVRAIIAASDKAAAAALLDANEEVHAATTEACGE